MGQVAVTARRRSLALALVLALVSSVFALGGAVEEAKADHHNPWDQPGAAWQGTITTKIGRTYTWDPSIPTRSQQTEGATYTNLIPEGSTADGYYGAHVAGSGSSKETGTCYGSSEPVTTYTTEWQVASDLAQMIYLETDDTGTTAFQPGLAMVTVNYKGYCDPPSQGETTGSVLGFESGASYETAVLVDNDPDPLHLVGTTTWTLASPPYELPSSITEYSFTATYDLQLVTVPFECDTFKTKSRKWSARTPIRLLPDRHWGDYKVTVEWCYDSRDPGRGKITSIRSRGSIDNGPFGAFGFISGVLGFETRWEKGTCKPARTGSEIDERGFGGCGDISKHESRLATVDRKMAFCFSWTELLDRVGVTKWLTERARPQLKAKIKKYMLNEEELRGPAFQEKVILWADDIADRARTKMRGLSEYLEDKHVPGFLAEWLEHEALQPFGYVMDRWINDIAADAYDGVYDGATSGAIADLMLNALFDDLLGVFRICDGGDFLPGTDDAFPGLLTLWQPEVTVNLLADGRLDWTRIDVYKHPTLKIKRV